MRRLFFLMNSCLVLSYGAQAQVPTVDMPISIINRVVKPEPEAAGLGAYGNYNLNLSTGQVDINVPICVLKGTSLDYPVSLSYDHLGIKVSERAGSAGANWNFNGSGMISRTVVGLPDDKASAGFNDNYALANTVSSFFSPTSFTDPYYSVAIGNRDLEPDIFSFSFNGRSGQFFYSPQDDNYYTIPYSKLKIEKIVVPGNGYYFTVNDESGYKYIFNLKTQTEFNSASAANDNSASYAGQWYLTEVQAPDGNTEFQLEYESASQAFSSVSTQATKQYLQSMQGGTCGTYVATTIFPDGASNLTTIVNYNSKLINKIKTPFEELRVEYAARTDGGLRIDRVALVKNDNTEKQSWKFHHGYYPMGGKLRLDSVILFSNSTKVNGYSFDYVPGDVPGIQSKNKDLWGFYHGGVESATLKFPRVEYLNQTIGDITGEANESTKNGILNRIYHPTGGYTSFEYELNDNGRYGYNGTLVEEPIITPSSTNLVRRTTQNGAGTSSQTFTLTSATLVNISTKRDNCDGNPPNGGANCTIEPCQTVMTLTGPGTNMSINGAVGVWAYFTVSLTAGTYTLSITTDESLDYGRIVTSQNTVTGYAHTTPAGGLRIKKITNTAPEAGSYTRKFSYIDPADPSRSSGCIPALPEFTFSTSTGAYCDTNGFPSCISVKRHLTLSQESNTPMFYSTGNPVAYKRVLETLGENGEGGFIDHRFSYVGDNITSSFPYPSATGNSWKRGLPIQTLYYSAANVLVKEELNDYTFDAQNNYHEVKGAKLGFQVFCPYDVSFTKINSASYKYISQWYYLNKSTTKTYPDDGAAPVINETSYFYDNVAHLQPTRIQSVKSDGSIAQLRTKYPMDYNPQAGSADARADGLYKMVQKNMIALPVEKIQSVIRGGQENITAATVSSFKDFSGGKVYSWEAFQLQIAAPLAYTSLSALSGSVFNMDSRYSKKMEQISYNNKGKPVHIKDETGRSYAVVYGYNGQLPLAYTKNAAANQVYYNGFEEETAGTSSTSKYGKKGFNGPFTISGVLLTTGTYLLSYWQWDGASWHYMTQNINHNGSSAISINVSNIIDEVSIRPVSSDINTFSYDPSIGITAKGLDNGTGLKFDLDNLGRLLQTRDHRSNILKKYTYQYQGAQ